MQLLVSFGILGDHPINRLSYWMGSKALVDANIAKSLLLHVRYRPFRTSVRFLRLLSSAPLGPSGTDGTNGRFPRRCFPCIQVVMPAGQTSQASESFVVVDSCGECAVLSLYSVRSTPQHIASSDRRFQLKKSAASCRCTLPLLLAGVLPRPRRNCIGRGGDACSNVFRRSSYRCRHVHAPPSRPPPPFRQKQIYSTLAVSWDLVPHRVFWGDNCSVFFLLPFLAPPPHHR